MNNYSDLVDINFAVLTTEKTTKEGTRKGLIWVTESINSLNTVPHNIPPEAQNALKDFEKVFTKATHLLKGDDLKKAHEIKNKIANLDEEGLRKMQSELLK